MHQRAARLVNLAAFFFLHLERLPRGDDDRGRGIQRRAGHALGCLKIEHGDGARFAQRGVIRVVAVLQCLDGLLSYWLAGHQPQNDAALAAQQMRVDELHAFRRQPGLAAAGGYAQAEIRHVGRKTGQRVVRVAPTPQAFGRGGEGNRG